MSLKIISNLSTTVVAAVYLPSFNVSSKNIAENICQECMAKPSAAGSTLARSTLEKNDLSTISAISTPKESSILVNHQDTPCTTTAYQGHKNFINLIPDYKVLQAKDIPPDVHQIIAKLDSMEPINPVKLSAEPLSEKLTQDTFCLPMINGNPFYINIGQLNWQKVPSVKNGNNVSAHSDEFCSAKGTIGGYNIKLHGKKHILTADIKHGLKEKRSTRLFNAASWINETEDPHDALPPFTDTDINQISRSEINVALRKRQAMNTTKIFLKYTHGYKDNKPAVAKYHVVLRIKKTKVINGYKKGFTPLANCPLHITQDGLDDKTSGLKQIYEEIVLEMADPSSTYDSKCRSHYAIGTVVNTKEHWHRKIGRAHV